MQDQRGVPVVRKNLLNCIRIADVAEDMFQATERAEPLQISLGAAFREVVKNNGLITPAQTFGYGIAADKSCPANDYRFQKYIPVGGDGLAGNRPGSGRTKLMPNA